MKNKLFFNFAKSLFRKTSFRMAALAVLTLLSVQTSWGQQQIIGSYPTMDGGFEGQTLGTIGSTLSSTKWSQGGSITASIDNTAGNVRTGNNCVVYTMASGPRYFQSPTLSQVIPADNADYIVQFYYKSTLTTLSSGLGGGMLVQGTTKINSVSKTISPTTYSAGTWTRVSVTFKSGTTTPLSTEQWAGWRDGAAIAGGPYPGIVDDFVIYKGAVVDVTAPNAASNAAAVANGAALDVSWTASSDTDGGGYVVVRYETTPNADNDPNVNGIYAIGNTITNGTGALSGTVVYIGTATSFQDTSVISNTNYYYKVYTVDKAFNYSTEVECSGIVIPATSTTWNGTAWSNGTPSASLEAVIAGAYSTTTSGGFTAKKLTVNSGSLTINTGTSVTVQNEVVNNVGANGIVVENNANLIQVNSAAVNTGIVVVNRNSSPLLRLDYTLWSSPVANQNLVAFSPLTSQNPNRFYAYDTASNSYTAVVNPTTTNFTNGTGYLIRMPNTADAVTPTAYAGQFTGVPNNGDIPFTLSTAGNGYNLVGNPYPSPISMSTLVSDNSTVISTTFYFWRKTNGVGTAYCTYNTAGSVFTTNGNAQSVDPAGIIQTGQGFFVKAIAAGSLVFKNGQRSNNTAGQFFRTKQAATPSRIWLNATNAAGDFSQMAVNYAEAATAGVDDFDSVYINDSALALTSNINGEEYTIQGRPAFDASDVVPLNFKTGVAGDYTIAIDHVDGLFANGQDVYLVDSATGTETNLKTDAYTFTATTGTANSRFSLKYQKTLKVDATTFNENNVVVYKNNGTLYVNSGAIAIDNIKVFDIQGRLVAEQKNVNANTATIKNVKAGQQALIVKVTSQENTVVNKKVMN